MIIRPATPDDAAAVLSIYGPIVADTVISFEFEVPTVEEIRRRIAGITSTLPWLVSESEGEVTGYAYAARHAERAAYAWSVDTSIYIGAEHRGQGLGRTLYSALMPILVDLGYVSAFAGITLPNSASVGVHETVGFRRIGIYRNVGYKMGGWHDVGWWGMQLRDLPADPRLPRPWVPSA